MVVTGSCHCRNISFTLTDEPGAENMPARACTCSFCAKHGAVWTTLSSASLRVSVKERARLSIYSFATSTAQFHICAECGVVPVVTSNIEGRLYAVVNSKTFENFDVSQLQHAAANFDGESEHQRLARRKRNWIADIEISEGSV